MGIFSRFKDIISANLNAMLEKAEDPEKLIKLMIQEMEDTLIELKAACASAMASRSKVARALDSVRRRSDEWGSKAELAVSKGRDDLAREALREKRRFGEEIERLEAEVDQLEEVVNRYRSDIDQLEDKMANARKKHQSLIQRHAQATKRFTAQTVIRKADSSDAFARFDAFENRIERMEADADLVNAKVAPTLEEEFIRLERDETLESELSELKKKLEGSSVQS